MKHPHRNVRITAADKARLCAIGAEQDRGMGWLVARAVVALAAQARAGDDLPEMADGGGHSQVSVVLTPAVAAALDYMTPRCGSSHAALRRAVRLALKEG